MAQCLFLVLAQIVHVEVAMQREASFDLRSASPTPMTDLLNFAHTTRLPYSLPSLIDHTGNINPAAAIAQSCKCLSGSPDQFCARAEPQPERGPVVKQMRVLLIQVLLNLTLDTFRTAGERCRVLTIKEMVSMKALNCRAGRGQTNPKIIIHPAGHAFVQATDLQPQTSTECCTRRSA